MGREVESLTLAASPANLERLRPILPDVLAATRCGEHRLEPRDDLAEETFEVTEARFIERELSARGRIPHRRIGRSLAARGPFDRIHPLSGGWVLDTPDRRWRMNPRGSRLHRLALLLALVGFLPGCAAKGPDPLERWNRSIFSFNEGFDKHLLEPVATGWDWVLPEVVQTGIRNFYDNITMPVTLANNILQLKPAAAAQDLGRIVVNTTAGVGGLIDVASMIEMPANREDFGQTLGRYGVPPGPYLMVPLLGPSTARDVWSISGRRSGQTPQLLHPALGVADAPRGGELQHPRLLPGGAARGPSIRLRLLRVHAKRLSPDPRAPGARQGWTTAGAAG